MAHDHGGIPPELVASYTDSTQESKRLHETATAHLPGGNTRTTLHFDPHPLYIEDGSGPRVTDVDGNEYVDFFNNATSLVHGHACAEVNEAATAAIDGGSAPGGPTRSEIDLASHLTDRIGSIERVRFANSGTEATMQAVRAARAYTGNRRIAKFEGIYHGTHDQAQISVSPPVRLAGPPDDPKSVPEGDGIHPAIVEDTVTLPFNAPEAARRKLERHADELAGVLIHPLMGTGVIPATEPFIEALDRWTNANDVLLLFDEVVSARIAHGGAQSLYDAQPDITALGKVIGGGFPVGAVGGSAEVMSVFDPTGNTRVSHSGTFNGNPVTMRAGLAALQKLSPAEIRRINALTDDIVERAEACFAETDLPLRINSAGSLFNIYVTDRAVTDYRSKATSESETERHLFGSMLEEGVRLSPELMGAVSTPMGDAEVEAFESALRTAVGRL